MQATNIQVKASANKGSSLLSAYRVVAGVGGLLAIVLVLTDAVPMLTALVYFVYGFVVPAIVLRDHLAKGMPDFKSAASIILLIPVLLPLWIVLISLLWASSNSLSGTQVAGTLAVVIVNMTYLLVWRTPRVVQFDFRAGAVKYGFEAAIFLLGLGIGVVLAIVMRVLS